MKHDQHHAPDRGPCTQWLPRLVQRLRSWIGVTYPGLDQHGPIQTPHIGQHALTDHADRRIPPASIVRMVSPSHTRWRCCGFHAGGRFPAHAVLTLHSMRYRSHHGGSTRGTPGQGRSTASVRAACGSWSICPNCLHGMIPKTLKFLKPSILNPRFLYCFCGCCLRPLEHLPKSFERHASSLKPLDPKNPKRSILSDRCRHFQILVAERHAEIHPGTTCLHQPHEVHAYMHS